eukprot:115073_1
MADNRIDPGSIKSVQKQTSKLIAQRKDRMPKIRRQERHNLLENKLQQYKDLVGMYQKVLVVACFPIYYFDSNCNKIIRDTINESQQTMNKFYVKEMAAISKDIELFEYINPINKQRTTIIDEEKFTPADIKKYIDASKSLIKNRNERMYEIGKKWCSIFLMVTHGGSDDNGKYVITCDPTKMNLNEFYRYVDQDLKSACIAVMFCCFGGIKIIQNSLTKQGIYRYMSRGADRQTMSAFGQNTDRNLIPVAQEVHSTSYGKHLYVIKGTGPDQTAVGGHGG